MCEVDFCSDSGSPILADNWSGYCMDPVQSLTDGGTGSVWSLADSGTGSVWSLADNGTGFVLSLAGSGTGSATG